MEGDLTDAETTKLDSIAGRVRSGEEIQLVLDDEFDTRAEQERFLARLCIYLQSQI